MIYWKANVKNQIASKEISEILSLAIPKWIKH